MMLRTAVAAVVLSLASSVPAAANSLSPWGVWDDESRRKGSPQDTQTASLLGGNLGALKPVALAQGGPRPAIAPKAPQTVSFSYGYSPGTIVIDTSSRKLYYVLASGNAYRYPIAVGKAGFNWTGTEKISRVVDWPDWNPPKEMRQRKPELPLRMTGGIRNPLGAKALYLGNSLYRIHGTNDVKSIGTASSSGCFRMTNGHVTHLASMAGVGSKVVVLRRLRAQAQSPPAEASAPGQDNQVAPPSQQDVAPPPAQDDTI